MLESTIHVDNDHLRNEKFQHKVHLKKHKDHRLASTVRTTVYDEENCCAGTAKVLDLVVDDFHPN